MQSNRTSWFDSHALLIASLFLLVFIPLYPKIPLFDAIPGYLVRVRLEDILVLLTGLLWIVQLKRNKILWNTSFFWLVCTYAVVGFLTILSGVLLLQTIPVSPLHLGKSFLHYFRYAEYFSVFFFAYAGLTSLKQVRTALWLLGATVITITIYGYGQLYWHWPLFSTMNREFSKGVKLYLTEHARVQSTFAGHYDLAGYLVLVLPLLLSVALLRKNIWERSFFAATHVAGLWLLVTSGSNIALAAYFLGTAAVLLLYLRRFPKIFKGTMLASCSVAMLLIAVTTIGYLSNPAIPKQVIQSAEQSSILMKLPGLPLALRTTRVALYPETAPAPDPELKPADVYHDIPELVEVSTVSATGKISTIVVEKDRTWSDNAIKYGLSMGIRLDTLWPQAIKGWTRNLYLGSGYGTLNKLGTQEFTEADSTDNNYFRTLGETGVFGFGLFALLLSLLLRQAWQNTLSKNTIVASIGIGIIGSTIGLLANAVIIDVFVASKVAFTFWALAGISAKTFYLVDPGKVESQDRILQTRILAVLQKHWLLIAALLLTVVLVHKNPLDELSSTRELSAAPESVAMLNTLSCWQKTGLWQYCGTYVVQPSTASLTYGALLFPVFAFTNNPAAFYYLNLALMIASISLLYLLTHKLLRSQWLQLFALLSSVLLLFNLETISVPVASNAFLPLVLTVYLIGLHFSRRVSIFIGGFVMTVCALQTTSQAEILHSIGPVILVFGAYFMQTVLPKGPAVNVKPYFLFMGTTVAMLLLLTSSVPQTWSQQLSEYRAELPALRAQTVRRANQFFAGKSSEERWSSDHELPYLISAIDPLYWQINSNQLYEPIPLSPNQAYFSEFLTAFGYTNETNLSDAYRSLMAERELYLIDAFSADNQNVESFTKLKQDFTLWQVDSDCDEACNVYEVRAEAPLTPEQPISINQVALTPETNSKLSFINYNHRFNLSDLAATHTTREFVQLISPINNLNPDLLLLGGDVADKSDAGQQKYFTGGFSDLVSFPIVYTPGNFDELETKLYEVNYQQFKVGNNLFIQLHPAPDGEIGLQQQLFINNILLQLEKQPEIKNIFFLSHRMGWIKGNPILEPLQQAVNQPLTTHDQYYSERLLPKLAKQPNKQFYFLGGDLKPNPIANVLFHQDNNVTYLASAVNNHPSDAYLQININEDDRVTITPFSGSHAQIGSISEYGVAHWQTSIPEVGTFQAKPERTALQTILHRILISILLGGVVAISYVGYLRNRTSSQTDRK